MNAAGVSSKFHGQAPQQGEVTGASIRGLPGWLERCARRCHSRLCLTAVSLGFTLLIGLVDYATGPQISLSVFYLAPVGLTAWLLGHRRALVMAVFAAVVWYVAERLSGVAFSNRAIPFWNATVRLGFFVIVALLLSRIRFYQLRLTDLVEARTHALEEEVARRAAAEQAAADASHREQQRIAHELHDGLCQELGSAALQAQTLADRLRQSAPPLAPLADALVEQMRRSSHWTRSLSTLLDPLTHGACDLPTGLSTLADRAGCLYDISCTFDSRGPIPELPDDTRSHLYRIAQEAIRNAVKHGHASHVGLELAVREGCLEMSVANDGADFPTAASGPGMAPGLGLRIMRCRAAAIHGRVEVLPRSGGGCVVRCTMPLSGFAPAPAHA